MTSPRTVNIMMIANKRWEAEPLFHGVVESRIRPQTLKPALRMYEPEIKAATFGGEPMPRLLATCQLPHIQARVQIWCIEDWMDPAAGGSNTPEKVRVLSRFFLAAEKRFGTKPDVIAAFGTAGIPSSVPLNGCVTVGTRVFVNDPFSKNPQTTRFIQRLDGKTEPMWTDPRLGRVVLSEMPSDFFRMIPDGTRHAAEARFLKPPIHATADLTVLAGNAFASIGTVNVTDYDDYVWADPLGIAIFRRTVERHEVGSVETTHGLIRLAAEDALGAVPRFFYISGITDSIGYFDMEVAPRTYAQNFAAVHNAGVVAAWLIPEVASQIGKILNGAVHS